MKACAPSWEPTTAPVAVDDVPGRGADLLGEPAAGVAVGDEADVVAVGLLRDGESALGRLGAHERLRRRRSEREVGVRELLGGEHAEHVGLVLRGIRRPVQLESVGAVDERRVVAGADRVEAELDRALEQGRELDLLVAAHARVGGAAGAVLGDEVLDDVVAEALREVPHVERDAEAIGRAPGIHRVLDRAASAAAGAQGAPGAGEREVHPDDVVPGVDGARGGDRGVDSAAHGRQDAHRSSVRGRCWADPGAVSGRQDRLDARARTRPGSRRPRHPHRSRCDVRPSVNRSTERASASARPIASTTCEGSGTPAWHAEPVDTAMPARSSRNSRDSPVAPGKRMWALPGRRSTGSPSSSASGTAAQDAAHERVAQRSEPLGLRPPARPRPAPPRPRTPPRPRRPACRRAGRAADRRRAAGRSRWRCARRRGPRRRPGPPILCADTLRATRPAAACGIRPQRGEPHGDVPERGDGIEVQRHARPAPPRPPAPPSR